MSQAVVGGILAAGAIIVAFSKGYTNHLNEKNEKTMHLQTQRRKQLRKRRSNGR